jgi:hypothetical protein
MRKLEGTDRAVLEHSLDPDVPVTFSRKEVGKK